MIDLTIVKQLIPLDHGLSVIITTRPNGTPQTSVVNAGVIDHPLGDGEVVAFVAAGRTHKLGYLRENPSVTIVVRAGWQWASVDGTAGPTAMAVVVHAPGGAKIACADLA